MDDEGPIRFSKVDQASPTCDCHVWNRPGFGAVDVHVMHVFREPHCWVRPLVGGLFSAPIFDDSSYGAPPIAAASDICCATVAVSRQVSQHDDACGNESKLSQGTR